MIQPTHGSPSPAALRRARPLEPRQDAETAPEVQDQAVLTPPPGDPSKVPTGAFRRMQNALGLALVSVCMPAVVAVGVLTSPVAESAQFPSASQVEGTVSVDWPVAANDTVYVVGSDPDRQSVAARVSKLQSWMKDSTNDLAHNLELSFENKSLLEVDRYGRSTLSYLEMVRDRGVAEGLDARVVVGEMALVLGAHKGMQQNTWNTCAATSVSYIHAEENPADYARVMAGLVSPEGTVKMADGTVLHRNATSLAGDNSQRLNIDRIYQASIQDAFNGEAGYDSRIDQNVVVHGKPYAAAGMLPSHMAAAMSAVRGRPHRVEYFHGDRAQTELHLKQRLATGERVILSMNWVADLKQRSNHAVVLEAVEGDSLIIRNPWGSWEKGVGSGPKRVALDEHGRFRIAKDEFFPRLNASIVPDRPDSEPVQLLSDNVAARTMGKVFNWIS